MHFVFFDLMGSQEIEVRFAIRETILFFSFLLCYAFAERRAAKGDRQDLNKNCDQ